MSAGRITGITILTRISTVLPFSIITSQPIQIHPQQDPLLKQAVTLFPHHLGQDTGLGIGHHRIGSGLGFGHGQVEGAFILLGAFVTLIRYGISSVGETGTPPTNAYTATQPAPILTTTPTCTFQFSDGNFWYCATSVSNALTGATWSWTAYSPDGTLQNSVSVLTLPIDTPPPNFPTLAGNNSATPICDTEYCFYYDLYNGTYAVLNYTIETSVLVSPPQFYCDGNFCYYDFHDIHWVVSVQNPANPPPPNVAFQAEGDTLLSNDPFGAGRNVILKDPTVSETPWSDSVYSWIQKLYKLSDGSGVQYWSGFNTTFDTNITYTGTNLFSNPNPTYWKWVVWVPEQTTTNYPLTGRWHSDWYNFTLSNGSFYQPPPWPIFSAQYARCFRFFSLKCVDISADSPSRKRPLGI